MTGYDTTDTLPRVAVVQLPGVNCEYETASVLRRAGLAAEVFRWNRPPEELEAFDAYVIPGGFSYEDRIRAGAVAAKAPTLDVVAAAAEAGKPVLGICNGAQVLVEAGLVPGTGGGAVELALAPNRDTRGYYCDWVHVKVHKDRRETAFTSRFEDGEVFPVPVAHAEGRFTVRDPERFEAWEEAGQVPLRYVEPDGEPARTFPFNPNGSLHAAAGVTNPAGNVLAFMPHPERAALLREVPGTLPGKWGRRRREGARKLEALDGPGPGFKMFLSLADYLRWGGGRGEAAR